MKTLLLAALVFVVTRYGRTKEYCRVVEVTLFGPLWWTDYAKGGCTLGLNTRNGRWINLLTTGESY